MRKPTNNSAIVIACLAYSVTLAATVAYAAPNKESNNNDQLAVVVKTQKVDDSATLVKSKVKKEKTEAKPLSATKTKVLSSKFSPKTKLQRELVGRKKINKVELFKLLKEVGFKGRGHKIAFALVMRESRCHPTSHNTNSSTGDNSYGLFQINMIGHLGPDRRDVFGLSSNTALFDPVLNAQAAYYMSKGEDFSSWGLGPNAYRLGAGEGTLKEWYDDYYATAKLVAKESK